MILAFIILWILRLFIDFIFKLNCVFRQLGYLFVGIFSMKNNRSYFKQASYLLRTVVEEHDRGEEHDKKINRFEEFKSVAEKWEWAATV